MILSPIGYSNSFRTAYSNVLTTRPSTTWGTSLTPGNNTYPAYASISVTATKACYAMLVQICAGNTSTAARDILIKIGMDPAGGSSYSDFVLHLLGSCASPQNVFHGGIWYYFPVYIPTGATLAASASVNNATVGSVRLAAWIFADPVRPEAMFYGNKVDTIGATTGSSSGTAVTAGTTNEGTWTSLGASTQDNFFWQCGMGVNDSTMAALSYHMDLGADNNTTTPKILIRDVLVLSSSTEQLSYNCAMQHAHCSEPVKSGTTIYGRLQCSGTADSNLSMIAYGVG